MSLSELKEKLRGVDTREVFVWRRGFDDWKRIGDVPEAMPGRPPPFRHDVRKQSERVQDQKPISNFIRDWLSPRGRLNRAKFWTAKVLCATLSLALTLAIFLIASSAATSHYSPTIGIPLFIGLCFIILVQVALLWPIIITDVKRLHDLNLSGWWLAVAFAVGFASNVGYRVASAVGGRLLIFLTAWMVSLFVMLYVMIIGCWRGTTGDNTYGPDPLSHSHHQG
jgi:uncharacterized membrane protein YhaH (DUF805 family)